MPGRARILAFCIPITVLVACGAEQDTPAEPLFASAYLVQSQVSGTITGPDGTSICNFVPPGGLLSVRTVPTTPFLIAGPTQNVFCPANTYSFLVDSGDYRIRVVLPVSVDLPWRWLEPGVVHVGGAPNLTKDINVQPGLNLGGGVTIDGAPLSGVSLTLNYGINPAFAAAIGSSGPFGTWIDNLNRPVLPLQANEQYIAVGQCAALGATAGVLTPTVPFIFPGEASSVDCQLQTSIATQYTNTGARAVATAFPGDIGGRSGALFGVLGSGWGVQFPLSGPPLHTPLQASQVFLGGLVISAGPGHILTGFDATGELLCVVCQDLGTSGSVGFDHDPSGVRFIRWRYNDASSSEALGLSVVQNSFDNPGSADYLLISYAITNTSRSGRTFFAGFFGDLDLDLNAFDDIGTTAFNGKLMYVTNAGGIGSHVGTLIQGGLPAGNFFFDVSSNLTEEIQGRAMSGAVKVPAIACCDVRYIQTVGPISLKRGETKVIWVALVMGDDNAQLLANAAAAEADIAARSAAPLPGFNGPETTYASGVKAGQTPTMRPGKRTQLP